jgi:hypothetical protein
MAKKKPTVQEQLLALCELVNKLSERVAELQLEVARLRTPNPYQPPAPMPQYGTLTFSDGTEATFTGPAVLFEGTKKVTGISFGEPKELPAGCEWGKA